MRHVRLDLPNGFVAHDVAVGDIDADGDNDVVVSGDSGTSILSNENGQFIIDGANNKMGGRQSQLFLGDITHNGWADLLSLPLTECTDTPVIERPRIRPCSATTAWVKTMRSTVGLTIRRHLVEMTGDGLLDIVSISADGDTSMRTRKRSILCAC